MNLYAIKRYYSEVEKIIQYVGSKIEMSIRNIFLWLLITYSHQNIDS